VIGGGAAGMMAAGRAGERGKKVLLLEKNKKLGQKLNITGGGRCNITNAEFDTQILLKNYGTAASFLFSPFSQFGVQDTFTFFESRGLPLIVEEGKRAFPKTQRAEDVVRVLEKYVRHSGVTIKTNAHISDILKEGSRVTGVISDGVTYLSGGVIIATGGASHPQTGSTGDGFTWLKHLGHTIHNPTPTLVPMVVREKKIKKLAGVSRKDIKITFFCDRKKRFSKKGNLLFTHFGISGPVVLNSSTKVGDLLHEGVVTAVIDFFPDINERELEEKMIALFDANKNKALKNIFSVLAPVQLLDFSDEVIGDTKVHSITREQRKILLHTLKYFTLTITDLMGLDNAIVVDGGLDLHEIKNKTMESTLIKNLYIVGDLLHIRRPSGGYSLQLCWTTGWVAGNAS